MSLRDAQEAGLREHNRLRSLHQDTPPMELSNDLCNDAQVQLFTYRIFELKHFWSLKFSRLMLIN